VFIDYQKKKPLEM